jgi:hypothetical protein
VELKPKSEQKETATTVTIEKPTKGKLTISMKRKVETRAEWAEK